MGGMRPAQGRAVGGQAFLPPVVWWGGSQRWLGVGAVLTGSALAWTRDRTIRESSGPP
jgi:hypothetical protein